MFIKFSSNDKKIIVKDSKSNDHDELTKDDNVLYLDENSDDRRVKAILVQKESEKKTS
jgi:hypothetical protein